MVSSTITPRRMCFRTPKIDVTRGHHVRWQSIAGDGVCPWTTAAFPKPPSTHAPPPFPAPPIPSPLEGARLAIIWLVVVATRCRAASQQRTGGNMMHQPAGSPARALLQTLPYPVQLPAKPSVGPCRRHGPARAGGGVRVGGHGTGETGGGGGGGGSGLSYDATHRETGVERGRARWDASRALAGTILRRAAPHPPPSSCALSDGLASGSAEVLPVLGVTVSRDARGARHVPGRERRDPGDQDGRPPLPAGVMPPRGWPRGVPCRERARPEVLGEVPSEGRCIKTAPSMYMHGRESGPGALLPLAPKL